MPFPLPAAKHLQAPAAAVHAAAGAIKEHASMATSDVLVHGPYVAMLAAEALVLYCLNKAGAIPGTSLLSATHH